MLDRDLTANELDIILEHMHPRNARPLIVNDLFRKLKTCRVKILADSHAIKSQQMGTYQAIPVEIIIEDSTKDNAIVKTRGSAAYGNWPKLGGVEGAQIDLIEHIDKLIPTNGRKIGIFTYQNGIQNTFERDFLEMGRSIHRHLQVEKPLCIGLYNKTTGVPLGIANDLSRLQNEAYDNTSSVMALRQTMWTFANCFPKINPQLIWVHIAHSEGGLIANEVLTSSKRGFDYPTQDFLKNQLITNVYGGVAAVPDAKVLKAINTYSVDDVTMCFIKKYLHKTSQSSLSQASDMLYELEMLDLASRLSQNPMYPSNDTNTIYNELKEKRDQQNLSRYIQSYPYESTKDGYSIRVVKSLVDSSDQPIGPGDHAFQGKTYQEALRENMEELNTKYGGFHQT